MPAVWVRTLLKSAAAVGGTACLLVAYGTNNDVQASKRKSSHFQEPSASWDSNWDKREPEHLLQFHQISSNASDPSKETLDQFRSKVSRHLILIRHGQYELNSGDSDESRKLTPLGHKQANLVGLRLKELALPYTTIIRSTMNRATETAEVIARHLPNVPVLNCDMIQEGMPIAPEPRITRDYLEAKFPKQLYAKKTDNSSENYNPATWGIKFHQDGARIEAAFRKYFHRADPSQKTDSYDIVVCHGNVIRYFVCRALQFPPEAWNRMSLYNCSITWIVIPPNGQAVLRYYGDAGYIPANMTSFF